MFDISKEKMDINCPKCNSKIKVSLEQVSKQQIVKCNRCQESIQLIDSNGSSRRGINDINKSFKDLEQTFKKIGKLKQNSSIEKTNKKNKTKTLIFFINDYPLIP